MSADWTDAGPLKLHPVGSFQEDRHFGGGGFHMYMLTALLNILAIDIILVLVLVGLVRKENSVFGHAQSENVIPGSC